MIKDTIKIQSKTIVRKIKCFIVGRLYFWMNKLMTSTPRLKCLMWKLIIELGTMYWKALLQFGSTNIDYGKLREVHKLTLPNESFVEPSSSVKTTK